MELCARQKMKLLDITEVQDMQLELMKKLHNFMEENQIQYYLIAGSALGAARHKGFIPWDDDIDIGLFRADYEKFIKVASSFDKNYDIVNYKNNKNCDYGLTRIYFPNTYIENPIIEKTKLDKRLYFDVFPLDNVPNDTEELKAYEQTIAKKKSLIQRIDVRNHNNTKTILLIKKALSFVLSPFRNSILASFDKLAQKYDSADTTHVCSLSSQYSFKKQVISKEIYGIPTLHVFETEEFYVPEKLDAYLTILYGSDYYEIPPIEKRRKGHNIYSINEV